ncbi:disintegrin and metalloproteinase domain-containing protein 19 isoform X2 [Belonocnema kinseyi]|uniref:disintegrin and metalloproteinase domain-containing protein 19 isoform X2 n=1 Tax=Belonocnema kinseyi TaxID=2817044 RepID=UPI00143CDEAB|nr:disintegrin and metalloproteinase domain-containing protein 19 isoform X2 [Belonocnema kinseyi]
MFWVHCGLFVLVIAVPGFISSADSTSKREADYTLDDSFWNEETPAGEVERLLRQYRQNQELVQNIRAHYYQIIYPVQLRHHEKMGISTRDASIPKYPQRGGYGDSGYQNARGRSRTGKHFHRTSLLIKAFNHRFRLDLELNTQLLAPNLIQKDFLANDAEQVSKQEIEHCYYHGTVRDYPGASAAFHTCNGVSGVIHLGNETFVIHPFYGGDLSQKHPHVIFEARTKANKGCANSGNLEWRLKNRRQKHVGLVEPILNRFKRDVREATKYIETAIIIDKAMFDKRNGSTRAEVVHDIIQVANIADLYFRTLNTRVSVVYIETWQGGNQAPIDKSMDIGRALLNFNDYTMRKMYQISPDTTQLLTGETFQGGESGMAVPETVCSQRSVGISVDLNAYEPHLLAGTMAHMIGHNIGMGHDDGREECFCRDWHGCIMAQSIVGLENVQPYKFSDCSKSDYAGALKSGNGMCLLNKPNELQVDTRTCGNRVIDDGEQCDCGTIDECHELDPCCDPITCKLTSEAECASGPCCSDCKLRARGVVCRESTNECDLPEACSGETGQCPPDVYKKNGNPCYNNNGYCFNGFCPALDMQCEQVWGYGGVAADKQCFEQFNSKGSINGHCGTDSSGHYVKCEPENVRCGSLQCKNGNVKPVTNGLNDLFSTTIISIKGQQIECKATTVRVEGSEMPALGLVRDGTSCGDNLICTNQTCTSLFPHVDQSKCPSNHNNNECSGNGVCTNINKCYCNPGWTGPDCSIQQAIPTEASTTSTTAAPGNASTTDMKLDKKETPYGGESSNLSRGILVVILVSVVKAVFVSFTVLALCYRRKGTLPKYDPPYTKKPAQKSFSGPSENHHQEGALDSVNKIISFGRMPQYSRGETQRVLFRHPNNVATADGTRLKEHKARLGVDEEDGGTGPEEVVSFIDLPPNNLTKLPEKGILKKHGGYAIGAGGTLTDVERTLNSLNGYHDDIIEALRNAATHRGLATTPSGSGNILDDEAIRKSLAECGYGDAYRKSDVQDNIDNQDDEEEEEIPPTCGTIRIRTLEDIIRQLEHHSTRHMSPSESEDIRMSETEADRPYRVDSSVCSESSQGSRRCSRGRDDDPRFVYGRYRQPTARSPYGSHQHSHQHVHQLHEEEGIYETADQDGSSNHRGDTPDSESDTFIQAQQQVARWTSEEGGQLRLPQQPPPSPLPSAASPMQLQQQQSHLHLHHQQLQQMILQQHPHQNQNQQHQNQNQQHQHQNQNQHQHMAADQKPIKQRGYYPSPPHTDNGFVIDEAENAQSQQENPPDVRGIDVKHSPNIKKCPLDGNFSLDCNIMNNGSPKGLNTNNTSDNGNTALQPSSHFPEYKH